MQKSKAEREAEDKRIAEYMRSPAYQNYTRAAYGTAWDTPQNDVMQSAEQAPIAGAADTEQNVCDYCGKPGHTIEKCADFIRDTKESAERDAAADKSDWPL